MISNLALEQAEEKLWNALPRMFSFGVAPAEE